MCCNRVQRAVVSVSGSLPVLAILDRESAFSSEFDDDECDFARNCRGQGMYYNRLTTRPRVYFGYRDAVHYAFSGCFAGYCCFCALHAGFSRDAFSRMGCFNCIRREQIRTVFAGMAAERSDGVSVVTWESHGWLALPSAIVDHILMFTVGLERSNGRASIRDGLVSVNAPVVAE